MEPVKLGVVGCGNISDVYFKNATMFESIEVVACADLIPERAKAKAGEHNIPKPCTTDELLADGDVEMVLNLTVPKAHAEVSIAALEAGKSVHTEKPLAVTREDGRKILTLAEGKGLRVGSAPDTFMGGGLQTCRKLIDDGRIGRPVAATAFFMCHGHESWHPDPEFFYHLGAGPMFDMGPYYLTALVALLGPVRRVSGATAISLPERTITSEEKCGQIIQVEVPTHVTGTMEFVSGALGTITMSFDVWGHHMPGIEIHGTEGSMSLPDPNFFDGPVRVVRGGESEWEEVPLTHGYTDNVRGIGPADMACGLCTGRKHRASGELAYHVLDLMHAFHDSATRGEHVELESSCERPAPLPMLPGTLD